MEENSPSQATGSRWGLWATIGFSLILVGLYIALSVVAVGVMYGLELRADPTLNYQTFAGSIENNGFFLSVFTTASAIFGFGFIFLFAALRKGITVKQYLDFTAVKPKVFFLWMGAVIVLIGISTGVSLALEHEQYFTAQVYSSAGNYPLFWFGIVIAAPVLEELFFRGFLFEGLRGSRLGSIGATLITSILWASIHIQYEIYDITQIFLLGLVLGIAKIKTRSVYMTMSMHGLVNFISIAEVAYFLP